MNDEPETDDDPRYAQVPADFPRPVHLGALPGTQPKLLVVKFNGRYYPPGCTPREIWDRWDVCEYLAQQFCEKSLGNKAGKRAHMSEVAILDQYLERLLKSGWGSDAEMRWVIRRAAELAHWPAPESALEPGGPPAPDV